MTEKYLENFLSHYWKTYRAMIDNRHGSPAAYDIGDEAFQSKVVEVLPKRESLRILGIGSGQGELDCVIMRRLLTRVSRIDNTVVEPSTDAMEVYKFLNSKDLSNQVSTTWYQETFQEYQTRRERSGATDKFHFIGVVHSLYYADKDGSSIGYLVDLLEDDGVLFIVVENDESGLISFSRKIKECFGPENSNPTQDYFTSKVVKLLDDDGRVTYDIVKSHYEIDVTACFDAESSEGSLIFDFLTHVVDCKSTVSKYFLKSLLDHLKSPDCSNVLTDGRIIMRHDWDVIIIRKK
ncbi:Histamine N-methyltransferase [Holothuria leucospilota]|uniref:Histamine N-methyltransferase n=1 Tax=Holothuria leucospilota TaxID=206669 RepID=A0A9Q1HCC8_HOLLE|nr:Histamine N-methyltransferase [Holothuria leucospilota]